MKKTIIAFGELLWDLLPDGAKLGGAPFNLAYRLHELGDRAVIVTRLGRDDRGDMASREVAAMGMETEFIQWDDRLQTGTVRVSVDSQREPDYFIVPGVAYDRIRSHPDWLGLAARADCFCYGSLVQRAETSRLSLEALLEASGERPKFFDVNLRKGCYTRESVERSLLQATILKLNEKEARQLGDWFGLSTNTWTEFCSRALTTWNLSHCLITLGGRGCFAMDASGAKAHVPGHRVRVLDTCGSGDAFSAGFIHRFLRGKTLQACCELGCALGALVATQAGATDRISRGEIERALGGAFERLADEKAAREVDAGTGVASGITPAMEPGGPARARRKRAAR